MEDERRPRRSQPSHSSADYIRSGQRPPRRSPQKRRRRRRRRRLNPNFIMLCILALVLVILLISCTARLFDRDKPEKETGNIPAPTTVSTETATQPPMEITSTATISATGDLLMHLPVINSVYDSAAGSYDFTRIFEFLDSYVAEADYAVANLETTLAGLDNGYAYSGYPSFNCPDDITSCMTDVGFDMFLTANNHCYDTGSVGLGRTVQVVSNAGLDVLGTQATAEDPDYLVKEINGIKVGMMCYSYATADDNPDAPSMNGIPVSSSSAKLISYFDYDRLDAFYTEVSDTIATMESAGAEAIVMYIHWGEEYQLSPNTNQTTIAQELCDLGIDVIVGGHPHVVQPVELLTSTTDSSHKTVCLYSMGNAISNQQRTEMNLNTGHTEDGVLFSFTFARYSDGEVLLDSVEALPTWVYKKSAGYYRILPLDTDVADWASAYGTSADVASSAQASYKRTMEQLGDGLTTAQTYLTAQRTEKLSAGAQ